MYTNISLMKSEVDYRQELIAQMVQVSRQEGRFLRSIRISFGKMLVHTGTRLSAERREDNAATRTVATAPPWNRSVPCPQTM